MKSFDEDHGAARLFKGLAPPQPPPDLRERVLRAAETRSATTTHVDVWTRVWESRGLRLVWAASVLLLLTGNLVLVPRQTGPPLELARSYVDEEIAEFLRPMRIAGTATPHMGRSGGGRHEHVEIDEGGNPS